MSHLSADRLAALADHGEQPTAAESAHLAACRDCAEDRLAHGALVAGARAERAMIGQPLTDWGSLSVVLRAEGLIAASPAAGRGPMMHRGVPAIPDAAVVARRRRILARTTQAAAAIVLLVGGALLGRMSAVSGPMALVVAPRVPAVAAGPALGPASAPPADGVRPTAEELIPEYRSAAEAQAALARYEVAYQHAAAWLAGRDAAAQLDSPDDYRTRLVALERAGRTMREAMEEAPYDPVITGYYLTTLGQREATLRQLNVSLPASERLNSF